MEYISFQASSVLGWLFESTIIVTILICLILAIKALTKGNLPAWWSYGLWLLLLARMLMPWGIESRISVFNYLPAQLENKTYMPFLMERDLPIPLMPDNFKASQTTAVITSTDTDLVKESVNHYNDSKESNKSHFYLSLDNALLIIWFTGFIFLSITTLLKYLMFRMTIRHLTPVKDKDFLDLFEKCRLSMGMRRDVAVIVTEKVRSPALFGYFKPCLLMPPHFWGTLERDELRYVLLHELSHLKRHDIVVSLLVTVLQIVHWFNPFVWYAFHHLRIDQEAACDAYLLTRIKKVKPADYAFSIVSLLERFIQNRRLPSLVGIIENRSQIGRRIDIIMNYNRYTPQRKCASVIILLILGLFFLTGYSGRAGVGKTEISGDFKETQLTVLADGRASGLNENEVKEVIDTVSPEEVVKKIEVKEEPEIVLARADTENARTQAEPLISAADKKQDFLSLNNTSEIEEHEQEQSIEPSKAVQQRQDPSDEYISLGLACLKKDQIDDAISNFNKAIELDPGNAAIYVVRGNAYHCLDQLDNAISDYNKAIEINPDLAAAYHDRGILYQNQGKFDKAISDYSRVLELNPDDALLGAAYRTRGLAYYSKGKYGEALSDYDKAVEFDPENANVYFYQGLIYFYEGKFKTARRKFNKTIALNPEAAIAQEAKKIRNSTFGSDSYGYITMGRSGFNIDHNDMGSAAQYALSMSYAPPVPIR